MKDDREIFAAAKQATERSIGSAGPRYTPAIDSSAPNLPIEDLVNTVNGLAFSQEFQAQALELSSALDKAYSTFMSETARKSPLKIRKPSLAIKLLSELGGSSPEDASSIIARIRRSVERQLSIVNQVGSKLSDRISELRPQGKASAETPELREVQVLENHLRGYRSMLSDVSIFADSPACRLQSKASLLLLGQWGTGKTHHLADSSRRLLNAGHPILFVLAKDFSTAPSPLSSLALHSKMSSTFDKLITALNQMGKNKGVRALLIIDGINESHRPDWRTAIATLLKLLSDKSHLGLIVSCRTPFDKEIFSPSTRRAFVEVNHHGFTDIEFDAQSEFFRYYNIPLPDVPLLAEEFSRPLTLKVLCEAFRELPKKEFKKGFSEITSGQRGMTFILETFVNHTGGRIEKDLGLPSRYCWNLIKGRKDINPPDKAGFAAWMASRMQDYIPFDDCIELIAADPLLADKGKATNLYFRMSSEGLLVEDKRWTGNGADDYLTVARLPYERFSDHIVARHLLEQHLNTKSPSRIRQSFYGNMPLGKVFRLLDHGSERFEMPGWAEAIIVEFPERTKKALPEDERELFFYLPKKNRNLSAYLEPCLGGMFWRAPTSVTKQTDRVLANYLFRWNEYVRARTFEVLFSVGTKSKHPYSGDRTYLNLEKMTMADRDIFWGEVVRRRTYGNAFDRLIKWCEAHDLSKIAFSDVTHLISLLSLLLTSVDRKLRDRVTKILVRLGEYHHRELFSHTARSLSFSDLYLPERMLAACFGVAMSQWAFPVSNDFRQDLVRFARFLVKQVFRPGGKLKSSHYLIRDYSLGIINLAEQVKPRCVAPRDRKYLKPPFAGRRSKFPPASKILDDVLAEVDNAIQMDFGNYTIGRLARDRRNYDDSHKGYQEILRKIKWRIGDLGYSRKRFEQIDNLIGHDWFGRSKQDGAKVDRYGKKYSWIAYFEMCGHLDARGKLERDSAFERISDCDIDPSFPIAPPEQDPGLPPTIVTEAATDEDWVVSGLTPEFPSVLSATGFDYSNGGESWFLLDGFLLETGPTKKHDIFAHFDGNLVRNQDIARLKDIVPRLAHPSADSPNSFQDHYTYAGEVPWSRRFAAAYRHKSGAMKLFANENFVVSRNVQRRKRVKAAWKLLLEELGDIENYFSPVRVYSHENAEDERARDAKADRLLERINRSLPPRERIDSMDFFLEKPSNDEVRAGYQIVSSVKGERGVRTEPTAWRYSWESYHSVANNYSGFHVPSPVICDTLGLLPYRREIELRDEFGKKATAYREREGSDNNSNFLYLRSDLLDKLLQALDCSLVMMMWGERRVRYEHFHSWEKNPSLKKALEARLNLFYRFYIYDPAQKCFVEHSSSEATKPQADSGGGLTDQLEIKGRSNEGLEGARNIPRHAPPTLEHKL
ncbi:MAG: hypothetical protein U0136_16025 [Bdellovibrionota bacterium]